MKPPSYSSTRAENRRNRRRRPNRCGTALAVVALAGSLAIGAASCGKSSSQQKKTYPVRAVLIEAAGDAEIAISGRDDRVPAAEATPLFSGDVLETPAGSGMVALFKGGALLGLREQTRSGLGDEGGASSPVRVDRGTVMVEVPSDAAPVSLVTPSASVTSREWAGGDTVFEVVIAPGGGTAVQVAGGTVTLSNGGGTVEIEDGEQSSVVAGQAPVKPVKAEGGVRIQPVGLSFMVGMLSDPYFRTRASRDAAADDARSKMNIDPTDPWPHLNLARSLADGGAVAEARSEFNKALDLDPQFAQALAGLGRIEMASGRWTEASEMYERARQVDEESLEAVLGMAQAGLGRGDFAEAEKWFKELIDLDPTSGPGYTGLGMIDLIEMDIGGARRSLREAASRGKNRARTAVCLAMLGAQRGNLDSWRKELKAALEDEPSMQQFRLSLGVGTLRLGDLDTAGAYYKSLTGTDDPAEMSAGYQGLGSVERARGALTRALADYVKSQDLQRDRPAVLADLGQTYLLLEERDAAAATFATAVELTPEDYYPRQWLSRAYLDLERPAEAAAESGTAISLNPGDWRSRLVLGLALGLLGDGARSNVELDRAYDDSVGQALTASDHVLLGRGHLAQGSWKKALEEFRAAKKMEPEYPAYRILLGDALLESGEEGKALDAYREALGLDPSYPAAAMKVASILAEEGKGAEAIQVLEDSIEKSPNSAGVRGLLSRLLVEDGDVDGALFQLEAALAVQGSSPALVADLLVTRGNALDRRQDFEGAIAAYTGALALDQARGDAWFYVAGDLERTGRPVEAQAAYRQAVTYCAGNPEWKKFHDEASRMLQP